jgi:hypothetical protein
MSPAHPVASAPRPNAGCLVNEVPANGRVYDAAQLAAQTQP